MKKINRILSANLHFIWVILFFIIHGYSQYQRLIPIGQLSLLFVKLLIGGLLLFWVSGRLLKDKKKGGILTSFILVIILFFGAFQDFFADIRLLSVFSYLRLLIVICLVVILFAYSLLRRSRSDFKKTIQYINCLFLLSVLIDLLVIFYQSFHPSVFADKSFKQFKSSECDSCRTPSVYLIVMDEYLGSHGLKEYFNYDNAGFEKFLYDRGFKVMKNTMSNYQFTLFSMASILNMNYIPEIEEAELQKHYVYKKILSLLRNNLVCNIFQENGYRIINLSPFEIENAPGLHSPSEFPQRIQLLTSQTMFDRILKYLPVWLADLKITRYQKKREISLAQVNDHTMKKALLESRSGDKTPAFVYVHLMMPHVPYVYDSTGRIKSSFEQKPLIQQEADSEYLQYLVYTNRRISQFIEELQKSTNNNAILMLISDHGYRDASYRDYKFAYQTFSAVYVPGQIYDGWYDGMSNVNQYRVLFNSVFGQNFSVLKDSLVRKVNDPGNKAR